MHAVSKLPLHQLPGRVCRRLRCRPTHRAATTWPGKRRRSWRAEMAGYVKLGFKAVKMKVGRLSPAEEESRVRAAREADRPGRPADARREQRLAGPAHGDGAPEALREVRPVLDRGAVRAGRHRQPCTPRPGDQRDRRHRRNRRGALVFQGTHGKGRGGHPAARRRRLRRNHRMAAHRGHCGKLRCDGVPALVPRPARAPRRGDTQRPDGGVLHRRPGVELSAAWWTGSSSSRNGMLLAADPARGSAFGFDEKAVARYSLGGQGQARGWNIRR